MSDRHPSDLVAQQTFLGADDRAFRKQQTRKRAPKDPLPQLPDGPCCARCANWAPPERGEDFGHCREAVYDPQCFSGSRVVMTRAEATARFLFGVEPLPTRGFMAGCSMFGEKEGSKAA